MAACCHILIGDGTPAEIIRVVLKEHYCELNMRIFCCTYAYDWNLFLVRV